MPPATVTHPDVLSGIASALSDIQAQLHRLVAREGAIGIRGATFNSAGRDIYNSYSFNYHIDIDTRCQLNRDKRPQQSLTEELAPTSRTSLSAQASSGSPSRYISCAPGLRCLAMRVRALGVQIQSLANKDFSSLQSALADLDTLVSTSSYAYDALDNGEPLNIQITRVIDWRILQCTRSLSHALQTFFNVHIRRIPLLGLVHHQIQGSWWGTWEAREVRFIHQQLKMEARHFSEWLSALARCV